MKFSTSSPSPTLDWTRAQSGPFPTGLLRENIEDFRVTEILGRSLADSGNHLYLFIEKRDINTDDVQRTLADHYKVARNDVSYSGQKDKRAIARQWFSVMLPPNTHTELPHHENYIVLKTVRHKKKLRRGELLENQFQITVRNLSENPVQLRNFGKPCPNYFGPQRFGNYSNNLRRALSWVDENRPHIPRHHRSRNLSTLRAFLFNEVLNLRIRDNTWCEPKNGDILRGGFPTGPLWGRGTLKTTGVARDYEESIRTRHPKVSEALEWVGLKQTRRPLAVRPRDKKVRVDGDSAQLNFSLNKGSYATTVLNEYFQLEVVSS